MRQAKNFSGNLAKSPKQEFGTMKRKSHLKAKWEAWRRDESGNVAIITAILLVVLVSLVAMVVDVGHVKAVRNELQNAADAAALAGVRALSPPVAPGTKFNPVKDAPYCSQGVTMAMQTINRADTQNLVINQADVQLGTWDWNANTFTPNAACSTQINAMRVTVRKDSSANQPVGTWFARVFGVNTMDVVARATAAMGYVKYLPPRYTFPLAISDPFLQELKDSGTGEGQLHPDQLDNGGWCGPLDYNPTPPNIKDWIENGLPTPIEVPGNIGLINGVEASVFNTLQKAIDAAKEMVYLPDSNPPIENPGYGEDGGLFCILPVLAEHVDTDPTNKFNQVRDVYTYQPVIITGTLRPNSPGNDTNDFIITMKIVDFDIAVIGGRPGGPASQLYATQPRLVGQAGQQY
jgi:Flp pilus assembly protein TadG